MTNTSVNTSPTVKDFRHRSEIPVLVTGFILTFAAVLTAVLAPLTGSEVPSWSAAAAVAFISPVIAFAVLIRFRFWSALANGVEINKSQFSDIYELYVELAREMGFDGSSKRKAIPRLILLNGNGLINAYASKCQLNQSYIVLYSDLMAVAYEKRDLKTIRFVLAHELAHIKCGHVALWRLIVAPVTSLLQFHKTIIRAQEYTADRVASYYAPEGTPGLVVLYAGSRIYDEVDTEAYFDNLASQRFGIWLRIVNVLSDHAVGIRRMQTLKRVEKEGWNVHGSML